MNSMWMLTVQSYYTTCQPARHTCGSGIRALLRPHLQQEHLVVAGLQQRPGHVQRVCRAQERPVPALRMSQARLSGFEGLQISGSMDANVIGLV